MTHRLFGSGVIVAMSLSAPGTAGAQPSELYSCAEAGTAEVTSIGVTMCDASATARLTQTASSDNLQVRDGALVREIASRGISGIAGLQVGDMIYRVGGVDITDTASAKDELMKIGATSDTVVNFLRGGRPYRVKLRRD